MFSSQDKKTLQNSPIEKEHKPGKRFPEVLFSFSLKVTEFTHAV